MTRLHFNKVRAEVARALFFILADLAALALSYLLAGLVVLIFSRFAEGRSYADLLVDTAMTRPGEIGFFAAALMGWFWHRGHYTRRQPFWIESYQVLIGCLVALLCAGFLQFALQQVFSRLWLVNTWILAIGAIPTARWLARNLMDKLGVWTIGVLVVGDRHRIAEAEALLESEPHLGFRVVASMGFNGIDGHNPNGWHDACIRHQASMVVLAAEEAEMVRHRDAIARLALEGLPFLCVQSLSGLPVLSLHAFYLVGHDVLLLMEGGRQGVTARLIKAAFDWLGAMFLTVLLSPLLLGLALAVRRDGGSVFYGDQRIGRNGRYFYCLKFRTMVPQADQVLERLLRDDPAVRAEWEATRKLRQDPRITPVGRFMRSFSLDELPQILNVLKGDMSLVGPRPVPVVEAEAYGPELRYYIQGKPGITGLWQVSGRNNLEYAQRVRLNTWYLKNWSLWLDILILIKTIPAVLLRKGAY
ncbi:exopolysaccharide biosynthesis polyprenyl glycosylphosphotransferase [Magnetospirillum molischianum]|uniref:Putative Undecaprenyl-phosphate galactose phosphotransferase n=1 Tax=Magnetospirillum molischianum DSM 120 TaxID=1150626 RepID=H8FSP0_MAGML|nr:exopolysaccharide biosynthesis polyprenyl glycosylphosphotransferase [Magnetospirillum molischianum]CCG41378.1 putative Undecaprenyl-phosphate galactose phosphotransferase [Magnetospirillum molischianum DSM 120]